MLIYQTLNQNYEKKNSTHLNHYMLKTVCFLICVFNTEFSCPINVVFNKKNFLYFYIALKLLICHKFCDFTGFQLYICLNIVLFSSNIL